MNQPSSQEIGARISRMRKMRRITQKEIASQLNVHQSVVTRWENGQIYPKREYLIKLAEIFSVGFDSLLTGVEHADDSASNDLDRLWATVKSLDKKDLDTVRSLLEAMVVRSKVQDAVGVRQAS
jgi:transcriptional regulator with XRE-family HTH domain